MNCSDEDREMAILAIRSEISCCIQSSTFSAAFVGDVRKRDLKDDNYACFQM